MEPSNPYQAPSSEVADSDASSKAIALVGSGRRFANYLIDTFVCGVIKVALAFLLVAALGAGTPLVADRLWNFLFGLSIYLAYYIAMESMFARTIGKLVTGTIVVDEDGDHPCLNQIIKRTFSRYIPFEPFSCFGKETVGWHDSLSKTFVVRLEQP